MFLYLKNYLDGSNVQITVQMCSLIGHLNLALLNLVLRPIQTNGGIFSVRERNAEYES